MEIILLFIFVFFTMSLHEFKETPKDSENYKQKKTRLIVSSVLMGIILVSVVVLFIMIMMIR